MDLTGLIENLCNGGQRWITKFEEKAAGQQLAAGDMKAILFQSVGKGKTDKIMELAGIKVDDLRCDSRPFSLVWNIVWRAVQKI